MYYYENLLQPTSPESCPACGSATCRNSPSARESERSKVLEISRAKMSKCDKDNNNSRKECGEVLRMRVAVRNTVRRLEKDLHDEVLKAFAASPF